MSEKQPKRKRTIEELEIDFKRQVNFLNSSCKAFDEGVFDEAIRMAISLRILFHDKKPNSFSVLKQMGIKDTIKLFDTSEDYKQGNLLAFNGLIAIHIENDMAKNGYRAFLDTSTITRMSNFNDWWEKVVIEDLRGNAFTRKDIVLFVAEQDGGAHVDPTIDEKYAQLSRDHTLGWSKTENGLFKSVPHAVFHTIRQITYEALKTFDERIAL